MIILLFFFFKQKTAYEMRISDWSSDVCSSDLLRPERRHARQRGDAMLVHRPDHVTRGEIIEWIDAGARRPGRKKLVLAVVEAEGQHRQIGRASCRERVCQYV